VFFALDRIPDLERNDFIRVASFKVEMALMASNEVAPANDRKAGLLRFLKQVLSDRGLYVVAIFKPGANAPWLYWATSLAVVSMEIVVIHHGSAVTARVVPATMTAATMTASTMMPTLAQTGVS
jgi:hypothetical protein